MKAWLLRALGAAGTLLFASLFAFTFERPLWVERAARDFISAQVEKQVGSHVARVVGDDTGRLARAADTIRRRNAARMDELHGWLQGKLHEKIAAALVDVRDPDCVCRERVASLLRAGLLQTLSALEASNAQLTDFIQGRYLRVVAELKRDLRIFTATNAAACLLLLFLSFARPRTIDHLVIPGTLLAVSVFVCSYCYVFEQNWFFTIIYVDYAGFAYLGLLTCVFVMLLDIFLNRGRIVVRLANGMLAAVGSAATLSTC